MTGSAAQGSRTADGRGAPCGQCWLAAQCPQSCHEGRVQLTTQGHDVTLRSFHRGCLALREGERPARCMFVKSGLLLIRQAGLDGVERAIAVIGPGYLLGFTSAHMRQGSLLSATALTPVSACELPSGVPDRICLARYTRQSVGTLASWSQLMRIPTLPARLAAALHLIATIQPSLSTLLPSQSVLAELLCVTRESINRSWREFEALGIVRRRHGRAVGLDLEALQRIARAGSAPAVS